MRRKWQIQRQFQSTPDAERRWDQVYQHLLEWTRPEALSNAPQPRSSAAIDGEMDDENNSNLRTSLDGTAFKYPYGLSLSVNSLNCCDSRY